MVVSVRPKLDLLDKLPTVVASELGDWSKGKSTRNSWIVADQAEHHCSI